MHAVMPDSSTTSMVSAASKTFAAPLAMKGTAIVSPSSGLSMVIAAVAESSGASDWSGDGEVVGLDSSAGGYAGGLEGGVSPEPEEHDVIVNAATTAARASMRLVNMRCAFCLIEGYSSVLRSDRQPPA
jgi:hypothetical protein